MARRGRACCCAARRGSRCCRAARGAILLAGLRFVRERRPEELLARECALTALAARGLRQLPGVEVFTGPGQSGVLSFRCRDLDCEEAAACLAEAGIAVRAGLHLRRWPTAAAERSRPERSG